MATSSIVMLSNVSMERLYLSQPPGWNDLQRLPYSLIQQQQQQQDVRANQQLIRTCYDKLLHHMYDINSSSTEITVNQIAEQLELAAEYCQLKTLRKGTAIYLHSDQFYLQINFDPMTDSLVNILFSIKSEQQINEERFICTRMLNALNEKQYKLFREHLSGFANLFTLTSPAMNNDKNIGFIAYRVLQKDLESLAKTDTYSNLLDGFQPMCEGLPMCIKFDEHSDENLSLPNCVRIVIVQNANLHYIPIKSTVYIDENMNTIQFDSSLTSSVPVTGHFAIEFNENQPSFTFLLTFAQEISSLTEMNSFLNDTKTFNYLSTILPKSKTLNRCHWHISHDQPAVSIRQIPFKNIKELIHILTLIQRQIYLTKYFNYYFSMNNDHDRMDDDNNEISLELSFLSSTILSITCAQSYNLSTFLLQMSNINELPLLINRPDQKQIYLTNERDSLIKLIEKLLHENGSNEQSLHINIQNKQVEPIKQQSNQTVHHPKINRRLSCGPPAKPTWRRATMLRRNGPACLTLASAQKDYAQEKTDDTQHSECFDEMPNNPQNSSNADLSHHKDEPDESDDDDPFIESSHTHIHPQILPKSQPNIFLSSLSRCTSVSSTKSVTTPPIFGLSPSTPYPGGTNSSSTNIFFPLGKQVSPQEHSPVCSPMTIGTMDPFTFLPANSSLSTATNPITESLSNVGQPIDSNGKLAKKKRIRSGSPGDDLIQSSDNNHNIDNRSSSQQQKITMSGGDVTNPKRGKKQNLDKNTQQQQNIIRQKSSFKITDSSTPGSLSQQLATSPDDTTSEIKPLKVVIKRVGDAGSSNDESQQQMTKSRKKMQPQMGSVPGSLPTVTRKLPVLNTSTGPSTVLVKSESFDMSQFTSDSNQMGGNNDIMQRERPRPSSSLSNPTNSLPLSVTSETRTAQPQPPIVLKIHRSKLNNVPDPSSSSSSVLATGTAPTSSPSNNSSSIKDPSKNRTRPVSSGVPTNKPHVRSPPLLAAKLTSPSATPTSNPLIPPSSINSSYRIPRKSSSQEVAAKPKPEQNINNPNTNNASNSTNLSNSVLTKTPVLASPNIRPSPPSTPSSSSQIGSWQSPPTQQPSRFHQNRPRMPWTQQQGPRPRPPMGASNISGLNNPHQPIQNYSPQPRSILRKPSNDNPTSDLMFMASSDLTGLNDQRIGTNFAVPLPTRTISPHASNDDNDDDSSPQAQLIIDTSSNPTTNNVLLPYSIVPGSNVSSGMDSFDQTNDNNLMMSSTQQHHMADEGMSNPDQ